MLRSRIVFLGALLSLAITIPSTAGARVLRVGKYHGHRGQYRSIQAAVDAATPGDWILIGPGDYKTTSSRAPKGREDTPAGVLITKPNIYLRGMDRNGVVVDATKPGTPRCSNKNAAQNFGPRPSGGGSPLGLNGIMVYKADNVWVQNLTVCNFLTGSGNSGNEVWWNGGDGSAKIGGWGFVGSYLNTTSTYFKNGGKIAGGYGIFSSNWSGGSWDHQYASNMNDSGFYIGACQQVCNQTVDHIWAQFNALGYSGSNSGGKLVVKNSEFDHNEDGFDTNSQNGDNPPPQNGACPHNGISPVTHTHSCWVFMHNYVHDNNNPNIPSVGFAGAGPVGTGISVSGGRNDTVMDNVFANNGAWGVIFVPFPDSGPPCTGGTDVSGQLCLYDEWGDALIGNTFRHNGFFGNSTNGDFAVTNAEPGPTDCFANNKDTSGPLTATPSYAEQVYPKCDGHTVPPTDTNPQSAMFTEEVACDSTLYLPLAGKAPCAPGDHYPRRTKVVMHPMPPASKLPSMPNPCAGVPANPWCPAGSRGGRNGAGGKDPDYDGDVDRPGQV